MSGDWQQDVHETPPTVSIPSDSESKSDEHDVLAHSGEPGTAMTSLDSSSRAASTDAPPALAQISTDPKEIEITDPDPG